MVAVSALGILRPAAAAEKPVDDGLLEFLGSVDSEDKNWHEYLAGTDIDQVASHPGHAGNASGNPGTAAPPAAPPSAAPPSAAPPPAGAPPPTAPPLAGHP
jgi:hypothetical protein